MLTDKQRQKIIAKLALEPSDAKVADKCGVSRTTVWRIRQEEVEKQAKLKRASSRLKQKEAKKMKITENHVSSEASVQFIAASIPPPAPPVYIDLTPKVDAEPVVLGTYFAAQLLRGEHVRVVAKAVMEAAESRGILFRKLQVMDLISVGTSSFVRFRSDLVEVASVLGSTNRGYISFSEGSYRITFSDGRQGIKFPTTPMLSVQKAGFGQTFAGPKVIRWAQQFASIS